MLDLMDFWPHGIQVMQSWDQVGNYLRIIDRHKVDLFVEVGVRAGGLKQFVAPRGRFVEDFHYLGCEIDGKHLPEEPWQRNAYVFIGDCFGEHFAGILDGAVKRSHRAFILCDGGNKPAELGYFKDYLRKGDLLSAHDYRDEISDVDLAVLGSEWREVEPERYRAALMPVFQRG